MFFQRETLNKLFDSLPFAYYDFFFADVEQGDSHREALAEFDAQLPSHLRPVVEDANGFDMATLTPFTAKVGR